MSENKLDFFQIYYKENQLQQIYDFAIPYLNSFPTAYLENSVIAEVVLKSTADFIGVASWRLKQKRKSVSSLHVINSSGGIDLTQERILSTEFDVAILTPRPTDHRMLFMAQHWHGNVWVKTLSALATYLRIELDIEIPAEVKYPVYGNHFIARKKIYQEYAQTCLIPVMKYMDESSYIFFQDAGYRSHKERIGEHSSVVDYEVATGRKDWPIGVFLLERLFSIWLNNKDLKITNL